MRVKQRLEHYRQWQREPFSYTRDCATHKCNNCGEEFQGNYCPICSQRARLGRITWKSVWLGFMELWGMHTRSMPYSLLQLLLRPGYFIGDYITGRRQVSFPPIKMLMIMGLLVIVVNNLIDSEAAQQAEQVTFDADLGDRVKLIVESFISWLEKHNDWAILMLRSFLSWPTWSLFRISPRCDHHTLPEGFFIQVFNSVHLLMLVLVYNMIAAVLPFIKSEIGGNVYMAIIIVQLYRTYKQLFGHSHWGTVWRMVVATTVAMLLMLAFLFSFVCILVAIMPDSPKGYAYVIGIVAFPLPYLVAILIMLAGSNACIKRQIKKDAKKQQQLAEQEQAVSQETEALE